MNSIFFFKNRILAALFASAALFLLITADTAQAQNVPITLKNGRIVEVVIVSMGGDHINWRYLDGGQVSKLPFKEIDGIEFPPTEAWADAMSDFEANNYESAAEKFKKLALTKGPSTYYPAPGNFTNLAQRRLIDCYRKLRLPDQINLLRPQIEWDKIPSVEKKIGGVVACWAAAGSDNHGETLKMIEAESKKLDWTDPLRGELAYIRAVVHRKMGDEPLAVVAFGEAYGAYPGVDPALSADAMSQAVTILSSYPDRKEEMRTIAHMYAGIYGDGKLWEGASADVAALLDEKLEMLGVGGPGPNKNKNKLARGRFVRIEASAERLSLAEVEVFSDGKNIASTGTATQKSTHQDFNAAKAIDGNTDGTLAGKSFTMTDHEDTKGRKWWELDLGASVVIDKVVVWNRKEKEAADRLNGFDFMVFSEDRKETVFEQRDNQNVKISTEFILNEAKLLEEERKRLEAEAAKAPAAGEEGEMKEPAPKAKGKGKGKAKSE